MAVLDDLKKQRSLTIECPTCGGAFRAADASLFDATRRLSGEALAVLTMLRQQLKADRADLLRRKKLAQERSQTGARAVHIGNVVEKIAGALPGFSFSPRDCRMLSEPIDVVVFEGYSNKQSVDAIGFVEIKSGQSKLSRDQQAVRKIVEAGKVELVLGEKQP